uniref:Uncharacterized protein n=1 Tax=Fulvimarina pelagi TaxID=217511 RepID=A0A0N7KZ43_9HYPH|nr:hypothetical protein [Fulvimarina pelagi]
MAEHLLHRSVHHEDLRAIIYEGDAAGQMIPEALQTLSCANRHCCLIIFRTQSILRINSNAD